jgi:uncharacterized membrane protein YfcA
MTATTVAGPALSSWRSTTIALGCALVIGGVGGLIGLGGGEFRLPILVGLIGFTARAAVPMNQTLSLVTLCTAFAVRWHTGLLVGVGAFAPAVIGLGLGGIAAAYFSARLVSKVSDHRLERAIAILLMAIGLLLIGERLLPAGLPPLASMDPAWQLPVGLALGLCIGTISTFLGVAGGELLIPTLIFVFGADIHVAGSATLFISIPTICMGLWRYRQLGLLPNPRTMLRIGLPMAVESIVGAGAGGALAGSAPADILKLLLGGVLVTAALKAFWKRRR